jgi:hypothetical protein
MGRFPVIMNVLNLKTEAIQMSSEAQNGDSLENGYDDFD